MNLWHPIGLFISVLVVYWSIQDDRLIRDDPDEFLRKHSRQEGTNFYFSIASVLNRVARQNSIVLAEIKDPDERRLKFESLLIELPARARVLNMTRWEIRFRFIAFAIIGAVLAYDWIATQL